MPRAVALGEKHLVMGYTSAGVDVVAVADEHEFSRHLGALARDASVAIVLATEKLATLSPEALVNFRETSRAALLILPSFEGATHAGYQEMRRLVERALGVDILGKDS